MYGVKMTKGIWSQAPLSEAVRVGGFLFVSGQVSRDPVSGEMVTGDFVAEARQALANLETVLKAGGASLNRVCKMNVYLTDVNNFAAFNDVYREFFAGDPLPSRTTVGCALPNPAARIEVEAVALVEIPDVARDG